MHVSIQVQVALKACVTSWAVPVLWWVLGGSAGEQPDCEQPGCCSTALSTRCGWLCPTVVNHWCIATPWGSAPTQRPTLCSSGELGPTPDMKPEGNDAIKSAVNTQESCGVWKYVQCINYTQNCGVKKCFDQELEWIHIKIHLFYSWIVQDCAGLYIDQSLFFVDINRKLPSTKCPRYTIFTSILLLHILWMPPGEDRPFCSSERPCWSQTVSMGWTCKHLSSSAVGLPGDTSGLLPPFWALGSKGSAAHHLLVQISCNNLFICFFLLYKYSISTHCKALLPVQPRWVIWWAEQAAVWRVG